jgi:hypothetical protein
MTQQITAAVSRTFEDVARRHGVSADAVATLVTALRRGGGTQAQFSHPELGGMGQWSRGGMIMVGDMFNHALKDRVDRLCTELSRAIADGSMPDPTLTAQGQPERADPSASAAQGARWPSELGVASSAGSQNDLHYAVFAATRRLAVERNGRITIYDTRDHRITGVSQQQSADQSITFSSQHGPVRLTDLSVIDGERNVAAGAVSPAAAPNSTVGGADIF